MEPLANRGTQGNLYSVGIAAVSLLSLYIQLPPGQIQPWTGHDTLLKLSQAYPLPVTVRCTSIQHKNKK